MLEKKATFGLFAFQFQSKKTTLVKQEMLQPLLTSERQACVQSSNLICLLSHLDYFDLVNS